MPANVCSHFILHICYWEISISILKRFIKCVSAHGTRWHDKQKRQSSSVLWSSNNYCMQVESWVWVWRLRWWWLATSTWIAKILQSQKSQKFGRRCHILIIYSFIFETRSVERFEMGDNRFFTHHTGRTQNTRALRWLKYYLLRN